jgi:N-terminal acetyltransferase B complex non-catalytic subunit
LKPGDELVLLAVQQLLFKNPDDTEAKVACAVLLETAIKHSPDNAYLKIAAIDVYYQLNAMSRSWEFFQVIGLKHIQLDSCIYTILPLLSEGGLYTETIELSNALLRFQATTARDCGDFAGRAMEAGILSKANEFMIFQRHKMNKSLAVMEAKGLILDAAAVLPSAVPRKKHDEDLILKGGLGVHQGIVGGDNDMDRATQMVVEVHNPYSALSLVSWADNGGSMEDSKDMADNRDMSMLFHQILYKTRTSTKESIVQDSLRRGHIHGMLIRATLCLDAVKGPKKGKIVKSSEELEKTTSSLLDCVKAATDFADNHELAEGSAGLCRKALVHATLDLCRVLAMINAGLPKQDTDSMEQREQHAFELLQNKALVRLKQAKEHLSLSSVKDVCSLLPNYIVPLFALFRMCSNICTVYGWGKRKRNTKRCAGAMADFAIEFKAMIQDLLSCLKR